MSGQTAVWLLIVAAALLSGVVVGWVLRGECADRTAEGSYVVRRVPEQRDGGR